MKNISTTLRFITVISYFLGLSILWIIPETAFAMRETPKEETKLLQIAEQINAQFENGNLTEAEAITKLDEIENKILQLRQERKLSIRKVPEPAWTDSPNKATEIVGSSVMRRTVVPIEDKTFWGTVVRVFWVIIRSILFIGTIIAIIVSVYVFAYVMKKIELKLRYAGILASSGFQPTEHRADPGRSIRQALEDQARRTPPAASSPPRTSSPPHIPVTPFVQATPQLIHPHSGEVPSHLA